MKQIIIYLTLIYSTYSVAGALINPLKLISGKKIDPNEAGRFINNEKLITGLAGGENSTINKHGYIAALSHEDAFAGSAVILNKKWLVTAAWNVYYAEPETFSVRVGSSFAYKGGKTYGVKSYYIYPNYSTEWIYDIALLKLSKSLKFSKKVKPIKLASALPANGTNSVVSGWGWDRYSQAGTQILKEATVPFIDYTTCKPHYSNVEGFTNYSICTIKEGVGPCAKDFGSPLVYKNKLIGVYSGAYECGGTRRPPVYADATKYKKWIEETIRHHTDEEENETEGNEMEETEDENEELNENEEFDENEKDENDLE